MTDIVTITPHPDNPDIICLHPPATMSAVMGRFEPARWATGLRCYLLPTAQLAEFHRYGQHADFHVIDERTLPARTAKQASRSELCDICCKPERQCQTSAGNRGSLRDHDFITVAQADRERAGQ
jgi:hypothetical protein